MIDPLRPQTGPQLALIIVPAILLPLVTIAVGTKFYSRRNAGVGFWYDDWFIALALFFAFSLYAGICVAVIYGGLGVSIHDIGYDNAERIKVFTEVASIACRILWSTSVVSIQLSLLCLNLRLFAPSKRRRSVCYILISACVAFWIVHLVGTLAQCTPLERLWNPDIEGRCINDRAWYTGTGFTHTGLNVFIFSLYLYQTITIRATSSEKTVLTGLLGVGILTIVFSLLRISLLVDKFYVSSSNFTLSPSLSIQFGMVEIVLGILCACVPTFHPAFARIKASRIGKHARRSWQNHQSRNNSSHLDSYDETDKRLWVAAGSAPNTKNKMDPRGRNQSKARAAESSFDHERKIYTSKTKANSMGYEENEVTLDDVILVRQSWAVQSERESVPPSTPLPPLP